MRFVLDTNIILLYLRDSDAKNKIESEFKLFSNKNDIIISVVTVGEIRSIAKRNKWGTKRLKAVNNLLEKLIIVGVNFKELIEAYAEIDTFSQGKHDSLVLNSSSRNMGKNDIWIASTAIVTKSKLMSTDKDFIHLNRILLEFILIDK